MDIFVAGFVKNSFIDWSGKISSVIFLGGCNFDCWYCHNRNILCSTSNTIPFEVVLRQIKEQIGFIDGVVISGGEPTLHPNLAEIIAAVRGLGLPVKLDTNGSNFEILKILTESGMVDFVAMDIKAPFEKYREFIGVDTDMTEIIKSAEFLKSQSARKDFDFMFRTTPGPGLTYEDFEKIAQITDGARWQKNHFVNPL
jgi:pyruvate formate lyase activating enzyme